MPVEERCPAEETRGGQWPFSSYLLSWSQPKGFHVLLLPRQQGKSLVLQVFFLQGCTLSVGKLALAFYPVCCLLSDRQLGLLTSQSTWWRKKLFISLHGNIIGLCRGIDLSLCLLADWKMSQLRISSSSHSWLPNRTREQQGLGLHSKSTLSGAHLAFWMVPLSCRCPGSLHLEGCVRMLKGHFESFTVSQAG